MPPVFTKRALELKTTDESLYCREEGYELLIADVANKVQTSTTSQITPDDYIKGIEDESCVGELMKSPRRAWIAKQLLRHIARYDEEKKSISTFDINYALYDTGNYLRDRYIYGELPPGPLYITKTSFPWTSTL